MYKPLPSYLTIKTIKVNGLGLFALENIALGTNMGMSHLKIGDTVFRTPLGGFINHANEANCIKAELRMTNEDIKGNSYNYKKWNLITIKDIKEGEELTVRYTFYNIADSLLSGLFYPARFSSKTHFTFCFNPDPGTAR